MKDIYQAQWENLGIIDPYWAVLTDSLKKGGKWDKEEFFESGQREIDEVMQNLTRIRPDLQLERTRDWRLGTALDFGCGVGRLSRALSGYFRKVIGVDISQSMLDEAWVQNRDFLNIEFVHNTVYDLQLIPSQTIDFIYSSITLQHMPAMRQRVFIGEFARVLRPGGVAVFQTPSRYEFGTFKGRIQFVKGVVGCIMGKRLLNIIRRMIHGNGYVMEMHVLPKDEVLQVLGRGRMTVAEIEKSDAAGIAFISYRYYAIKN